MSNSTRHSRWSICRISTTASRNSGPTSTHAAADLRKLDAACGVLLDHFQSRGAGVIVLSEYGITRVSRPVHLNRVLREHGLLTIREELGHELLDAGTSAAFAVADHQIAHIYVNDPSRINEVRRIVEKVPGVERVLDDSGKRAEHLNHSRAGELVAIAEPDAWFTYYYWLDDRRAPDFARTVDIHRKPGYDPVELFIDPRLSMVKARIGWTLAKRKAGFRSLLQLIPTDATLVRGSHGRAAASPAEGPLFITNQSDFQVSGVIQPTEVFACILQHLRL